jgi:type I restriction enzyme R subunit
MASEADTRANYIDPALRAADWQPSNIIREHYFTDSRNTAGSVRGRRCFVDYLLHKDNWYLAVVEAKKESEQPAKGLQQAIDYANKLRVRFVYSSNGKQTYEFDLETGKGDYMEFYPTSAELVKRYAGQTTDLSQELRSIPFHLEGAMQLPMLSVKAKAEISEKITMMQLLKASILDSGFKEEL